MTTEEFKQVDDAIYEHLGDAEFEWNDDDNDNGPSKFWIFNDLLNILAQEGLDLKIIPKK